MNTMWKKIAIGGALAVFGTLPLLAGPGGHHGPGHSRPHYGNSGVRLAAEIVGLVRCATAPIAWFVAPPPPPQPYFVEAAGPGFAPPPPPPPPPPRHGGWHRHRGPGWRR